MTEQSSRPLIGITLDSEESGGYSKYPWYALRQNYADSVVAAGGLPIALPHTPELAEIYLDRIDALIITGGAFDVDPSLYGDASTHPSVTLKAQRTRFEWAITQGALERDMPTLGICGGQQLLNVVLGGTLIQHIPDSVDECLAHEQPNPRHEPGHDISILDNTLLHRLTGTDMLHVNSAHHQAADTTGEHVIVSARADDNVIEAIEHPGYAYCLGVQWHPEFLISDGDRAILKGLIEAASR